MIFLDSNVILRYLTSASEPAIAVQQQAAAELFESVDCGELEVTTSEVVVHECCFILASKKQYGIPHHEVVELIRPIIQLRGLKLPRGEKDLFLRALDVYQSNPKLEFSDSVVAVRAEKLGAQLATFDRELSKLPIVNNWRFSES